MELGHPSSMDPEAVENTEFATVRRGYEPAAVRTRLQQVASEIRHLNDAVTTLSARVNELEEIPSVDLESGRVAEVLGEEAARLLQTAREAAQERLSRAEAECEQMIAAARGDGAVIIDEARAEGRAMVMEARKVRERMLADLARRRHDHRVEVEKLRVIRARLTDALILCGEALEGWIDELGGAEAQAVAAAETAVLRMAAEPGVTVGEIEAEIQAGQIGGSRLDRESGDAREAGDGRRAGVDNDERPAVVAVKPVVVAETVAAAEPLAVAELAEAAEPADLDGPPRAVGSRLDDPDELEDADAIGEAVAVTGVYDVEAESDLDPSTDLRRVGARPDGHTGLRRVEGETTSDAEGPAGAIFERLRSITGAPVPEPPASAARHAGAETSEPGGLVVAARAVAVGGMARRLKRLVVDEQSSLLDGIRRSGMRAVRTAATSGAAAYARAIRAPLEDFASDIDVSIDDIDLQAAGDAIVSVLVEPIREQLGKLAEGTEDLEELTSAVRSIYRESRANRADSAAEAAFAAAWPDALP